MKIITVIELTIPAIKIIRFGKFTDHRGYFTEPYRMSDLGSDSAIPELRNAHMVQSNESWSRTGVIRGLHFQWNPFMGKLVRTLSGRMIDIVLDIRKNSPTCGKGVLYDMPAHDRDDWDEWIWVPPGFAHGNLFLADTRIEYMCTGEYSQGYEAGICPFAEDIDWSLGDPALLSLFRAYDNKRAIISDKDRDSQNLEQWFADPRSTIFTI